MSVEDKIKEAAKLLKQADGLLIGAGAGMGIDSGLPDYRGNQGFWKAYPALGQARIEFVRIANPASFLENPKLAWGFYGHRLQLYRDTIPHRGFHILQELAANMEHQAFVYTSNVDGQFQKAGFSENHVAECHGTVHYMQCAKPCSRTIWSSEGVVVEVDVQNCLFLGNLPACIECGHLARPNILMFNDWQWVSDLTDLQMSRLNKWYKKIKNLVVIELGAGTSVPSVRRVCEATKAPFIRINPMEPEVPHKTDIGLPLNALDALQKIQAAYLAL